MHIHPRSRYGERLFSFITLFDAGIATPSTGDRQNVYTLWYRLLHYVRHILRILIEMAAIPHSFCIFNIKPRGKVRSCLRGRWVRRA